jgi:hypothetical protein
MASPNPLPCCARRGRTFRTDAGARGGGSTGREGERWARGECAPKEQGQAGGGRREGEGEAAGARGRVRAEGVRLTFPTLWANLWAWTTKPIHNDFGIPIHLGVLFKYSWYSSP